MLLVQTSLHRINTSSLLVILCHIRVFSESICYERRATYRRCVNMATDGRRVDV